MSSKWFYIPVVIHDQSHAIYCIIFLYIDEAKAEIEKLEDALDEAVRENIFSKANEIQLKIDKIKKDKMSTNQDSLQGEKIDLIKCLSMHYYHVCLLGKYIVDLLSTHLMIIFSPCPFIVFDKKFHPIGFTIIWFILSLPVY